MILRGITISFSFAFLLGFGLIKHWKEDGLKSKIGFEIKGPFGLVHGSFTGLKSEIVFDENDLKGSSIFASIDSKSVSTGIGLRNSDLRNKPEWLDSKKYPIFSFHSTKIEKSNTGYKVVGDLTLKGVVKSVDIPFTFSRTGSLGTFKGAFNLKRSDFHIGKEGGSVANEMKIIIEVAVK